MSSKHHHRSTSLCPLRHLPNKQIFKKHKRHNKETQASNEHDEEEEHYNEEVSCENNHIYYYADVNTKNILQLIKHINALNHKLRILEAEMTIKYGSSPNMRIYLHINSYGVYITDALAGVDCIQNSKIPIVSIIEGCAASAGTLLSVVAKERQITTHSSMLIHQLSGSFWGTYEQMKDDLANSTYLEEITNKIYLDNTHGKLKKKKLAKYLKRDLWWDATKCKKLGLVDEII